jgi:hypothetical protein
LLHAIFRFVDSADEGFRLLPTNEISEVLGSSTRQDRFIGVAAAGNDAAAILYRGNLDPLVVPVTWFRRRASGPRPDLARLAVSDFGQTVGLGDYQAATDAILYEFDGAYRRRAKARLIAQDRSFGGALRRIRLQRGLARTDFPGINAKEIARIERGEGKRPHAHTLVALAKRLGVAPASIATF